MEGVIKVFSAFYLFICKCGCVRACVKRAYTYIYLWLASVACSKLEIATHDPKIEQTPKTERE